MNCVTKRLSSGYVWVTNIDDDAVNKYIHIRTSVIWFDWGIRVRVNRDKLSSSSLSTDWHRFEKWNKIFVFTNVFVWKTRRFFFFFSLSGKTQVNIYLLSLLILNSMYVTRSRQSEGRRSLNTSILIISLAK
jgi:hypothetical protein